MKPQYAIYLIIAVFFLAAVFCIVFLVHHLWQSIKENSGQILSDKAEILSLDSQDNALKSFKKNYDGYKVNLDKADQLFVNPDDPIAFISFLEKTASDSSVAFDIALSPPQKGLAPSAQPAAVFQISAKGSFTNIATFIQRLERGPYLLGLQHVSIKNIGQGGDTEGNPFRGVEAVFSIEVMTRS